jgi:MFS family permease
MTIAETAPVAASGSNDASRILVARGLRAFGDGFVALLVPIYLLELGFSALAIGAIVTSTLIGTALLTLWAGMVANRYSVRRLLLAAALLMAATGAAFAVTTAFWPLLLIAFVGTMNPTSATPASSCHWSRRHWPRPPSRGAAPRSSPATA